MWCHPSIHPFVHSFIRSFVHSFRGAGGCGGGGGGGTDADYELATAHVQLVWESHTSWIISAAPQPGWCWHRSAKRYLVVVVVVAVGRPGMNNYARGDWKIVKNSTNHLHTNDPSATRFAFQSRRRRRRPSLVLSHRCTISAC